MFKKLKEKITEEVKSSPQRFAEFTQTVSDKLQNNTSADENFFTIGEEDANTSTNSTDNGFSSVSLVSPSQETRSRRLSNSSMASDVSFLPKYESGNMYHLQSDWDASASEMEDNASTASSQLGHLSKEQIYSAFQKSQMRYHKYRGRYTDLARHYKDLERENAKMKSVLVETQDKAIRRVAELKEQCTLEQKAKAHLESSLRDEMDERNIKIQTLQTKIGLLQSGNNSDLLVDVDNKDNNSENLENLTKYLNDARKEIETLNEKIQEMKANSIIFQSKEQEYKTKISRLEKEITQFSEREKENNLKLAQSKMELHNEIVVKDAEMSNLKKENETLKQKLETLETEHKGNVKMENLQSQNKKLIDRVESLTQKCNVLENDLLRVESYKIEIQELKEREDLLNREINDLKKMNEEAGLDKKLLEELVDNLKQEKSKFEETIAKEKKDFEEQLFSVREDAKKALLTLEPKIREKLQREQAQKEEELKREFTARLEELSSSSNNVKEVQMKIYEKDDIIKKYTEELDILKEELSKRKNNYSDLERNHLESIEESNKLRNTISNLEKEKSNFENYEEKIARMQAHIETLQEEIRELSDVSEKKEEENVFLSKENLNLQHSLSETHRKLRILEEKYEAIHLNTSESKLLELKVHKLEEEKKSLMDEFELERKMFNELILDHKDVKQKEEVIVNLEETLSKTHFELNHLKHLYIKEREKNVMLFDKKQIVEEEVAKLQERIRIFEEKDEAIDLDKSESGLLELKLQKLEEENRRLLESFELERVTLEKELDVIKQDLMDKEESITEGPVEQSVENTNLKDKIHFIRQLSEVKERDNVFLSKENMKLQQENTKLLERVRILEEKYEAIALNSTESRLLEIKLQKLEEENKRLLDEFEMERKMFNEMLENHKELEEREQVILELEENLHKAHEEIVQLKEALAKEKEETVYLQKRKLDFEKKIEKMMERIRISEERDEVTMMDKNESNLLEMKLQKLDTEQTNLLETFELERKTFNKFYEEYVKNENKLKKLVEENLEVKQVIKRGKKEMAELSSSLKKTAEEYQEIVKENQLNLKKIDELNEKIKNQQKLLNENEAKVKKVSELDAVNEKLKTEITLKNKEVSELSQKIADLSDVIQKQTTDFNSLLDRTKQLEFVLEKMRMDSTETLKQEKEKQNELTSKIEELQKELQEKTKQFTDLSRKLAELEDSYNQEKNKHKEKIEETESLKKKLQELQHLEQQFMEEKQGLNRELGNFKAVQKEKALLENKLKQTENDLKVKNGEFRVLEQECNLLKEEKENLLGEIKNLRDRIGDLTQENNDLKNVSSKVTESEYKLKELQTQNQALQGERDNLDKEMSELNLRINRISADNRHVIEENQTLIHNGEELKIKMEYLEKEKGEFDEIRSKLMQEITVLTNSVDEIRQQLHDVQKQNVEMAKERNLESGSGVDITKIQQDFYEIKEKCDSLFVENKSLKTEYTKLEEKCNDFSKIKKKLETQISELENQYTEILHEKQLLQDEVQELKISPVNAGNSSKLDQLTMLKQEKAFTTDAASTSNSDKNKEKLLKEIDLLQDKVTQYKSLDITNKSSIEFYENELQKVKNQNEKLNRKLDETLVTLNHCTELSTSTEVEYLKNVLYNYMLGKESVVLARVIAAVCKFDPHQTEAVLQREQQKQTLLGQLGLI